ncbi:MAG: hypothetical protein ABIW82_11045 [Dokdonella sp.]
MKSITLYAGFAFACLIGAASAHASGLWLTPQHPVASEPFMIDYDYVTNCTGPLDPLYPTFATLHPPNPSQNLVHVAVLSFIQCFVDSVPSHVVHVSAAMTGLAAGNYPIYSEVSILNGFDPPYLDVILQGNISVAATPVGAPTLSTWGLLMLALSMGAVAIRWSVKWKAISANSAL